MKSYKLKVEPHIKATITQKDLAKAYVLKKSMSAHKNANIKLDIEYKALADKIINEIEEKDTIESGEYTCGIKYQERQDINWKQICEEVLGKLEIAQLKLHKPKKLIKILEIIKIVEKRD